MTHPRECILSRATSWLFGSLLLDGDSYRLLIEEPNMMFWAVLVIVNDNWAQHLARSVIY